MDNKKKCLTKKQKESERLKRLGLFDPDKYKCWIFPALKKKED